MLSQRDQLILRKALTFANGYRELGMYDYALAELGALSESLRSQRECQQMQLAVFMEAKRWKEALPFANVLAANESSDPGDIVNLAYVVRRADSVDEARVILETAIKRYPDEAILHYNLGCYACCTNELDTAKRYLERAFQLDGSYFAMSLGDEDLRPMRAWLKQVGTKENSD